MAHKKGKKTLAADIKISSLNEFKGHWKSRRQVHKRTVTDALRLWASLAGGLTGEGGI